MWCRDTCGQRPKSRVIFLSNYCIIPSDLSSFVFTDVQSTETFRQSDGPKIVIDILNVNHQICDVLDGGFAVIAAAAAGNEVVKESFMGLKVDELFLKVMREKHKQIPESLYDAIRVLLTPDDNRVLASQVCTADMSGILHMLVLFSAYIVYVAFS